MSLKGTKTHENLKHAFAGESQANRRYLWFAQKADVEGYPDAAALFRSVAEGETGHAHGHLEFIAEVGDPATDLPIGETEANLLADKGCMAVVEGGNMPCSIEAMAVFKARGVALGPYKATLAVGTIANGGPLELASITTAEALDSALRLRADKVFTKIKATAKEYNKRGDLHAGAQISAFVKVAKVMSAHGAV